MHYKKIRLSKEKTIDEHRLVLQLKLGRPLSFNEIAHHKDENKRNNSEGNIVLMSRAEHGRLHSTGKRANDSTRQKIRDSSRANALSRSTLSPEGILQIKDELLKGVRQSVLARRYGVTKFTIHRIAKRKAYAHIIA